MTTHLVKIVSILSTLCGLILYVPDSVYIEASKILDEIKHISPIANSMSKWDVVVGDAQELTYAERGKILDAYRGDFDAQK